MQRSLLRGIIAFTCLVLIVPAVALRAPEPALAAASLSVGGPGSVTVGETVTFTVNVNTGGDSANAFDATFSYPTSVFEGVRGTYAGSICTLPISQPDPSGGTATISCGRPGGYTGSGVVASIVLKAIGPGSASLGLSGCSVLANDGLGTNITGSCSGKGVTVDGSAATPTPAGSTPTPAGTATPKATAKPKTTPTPGGATAPVEAPKTPEPTATIEPPAASVLPESTPTPEAGEESAPQTERRSIGQALQDVLRSFRELGSLSGNMSGMIALLLTMLPALALGFGIVFLGYRLYLLERRRRRTLDRLFELELAELASLEGKLDLLAEKGAKGREQFKEEFQSAKENILRQIKPNYGKPVDGKAAPAAKTEEPPAK